MLKSALAAALVAATLAMPVGITPAKADVGVGYSFGVDAGPSWRHDRRGVEDRRWRGDDKRGHWQRRHHRADCRTVIEVKRIYNRHGRVIRVIETPVEVCRPRWR